MKRISMTLAAGLIGLNAAVAEGVAPEAVMFEDGAVKASISGTPGDAVSGAKIMTTRSLGNCVACHQVTALASAPFHGTVGPSLDGAGDRWTEEELRGIVSNAKMMFDGTIMPAFYKTSGYIRPGDGYTGKAGTEPLPPILSGQQMEDIVAFLLTLKE